MKIWKEKKGKKAIIMPLIVVFMIISIITTIIIVGTHFGVPLETAEINRDIETNEEKY